MSEPPCRPAPALASRWKLAACIVLSLASILLLIFVGLPLTLPQKASGAFYWERILSGFGRELERTGDRVVFFWSGIEGWTYHQTTRQEIEAERVSSVRKEVDNLVGWYFSKGEACSYHLRFFELLTGYDRAKDKVAPAEWWKANRHRVQPTQQQVQAFLDERKRVLALRQAALAPQRGDRYERQLGGYDPLELMDGRGLGASEYVWGVAGDARIERWRAMHGRALRTSFVLEALYFPALVFYIAYGVMFVVRRLRDRERLEWVVRAVALMLINVGIMLPYFLGYDPDWTSTAWEKGTILYNGFLSLCTLPAMLLLELLSAVPGLSALLAAAGDLVGTTVGLTLTYGLIGAVIGLAADLRGRRRTSPPAA